MRNIQIKDFVVFILLLYSTNLKGQNKNSSYRDSINLSNFLLFKCDTVRALDVYRNLIKSDPRKVFFHDYKNAIILGESLNDSLFVGECLYRIYRYKRLDVLNFEREFSFISLKRIEDYKAIVSTFDNPIVQKNNYYLDMLITLYTRDVKAHESFTRGAINANQRDSIDSLNFSIFYNLLATNQFKGENEIGLFINNIKIWDIYLLLFRHFVQAGYGEELISFLQEEHEYGHNLPIEILAIVLDLNDHINKRLPCIQHNYINMVGNYVCRPLINYDSISMKKINDLRANIGLEKFHLSLKYFINQMYCESGIIQYYKFFSFAYVEDLPAFLYSSKKDKIYIKSLSIDIENELNKCLCQSLPSTLRN